MKPVSEAYVIGMEGDINSVHRGVIPFQLTTGAMPSEALLLRGCDLDMSGPVWTFTPEIDFKETRLKNGVKPASPVNLYIVKRLAGKTSETAIRESV